MIQFTHYPAGNLVRIRPDAITSIEQSVIASMSGEPTVIEVRVMYGPDFTPLRQTFRSTDDADALTLARREIERIDFAITKWHAATGSDALKAILEELKETRRAAGRRR